MMGEEMEERIGRIEAMVREDRRTHTAHGQQVTCALLSAAVCVRLRAVACKRRVCALYSTAGQLE